MFIWELLARQENSTDRSDSLQGAGRSGWTTSWEKHRHLSAVSTSVFPLTRLKVPPEHLELREIEQDPKGRAPALSTGALDSANTATRAVGISVL